MIADPLRLYDCVMPCAGAEAFLVMRADLARRHGLKFARVLATIERHNAFAEDPIALRGGWVLDRDELYAQAGAGPEEMDFIETYDDYPVMTLRQFEGLGLCGAGEAPDFVRRETFTADGTCPLNTCGGQLSCGQAGAAGGFLGLVEAVRQLTRQTLGAQVRNPRLGLVSGYGMVTYDRGVCSGAAVVAGE
jgi:acetyl-CoA acetyltransferase